MISHAHVIRRNRNEGLEIMGLHEYKWEESLPCPKCKKDTTFYITQWEDLNEMVTGGICSVC